MSDLVEFLLARVAEIEAEAREAIDSGPEWVEEAMRFGADPARVLAECEAMRRIVALHKCVETVNNGRPDRTCDRCAFDWAYYPFEGTAEAYPCATLRLLALPYASHPDYDPAWAVPPHECRWYEATTHGDAERVYVCTEPGHEGPTERREPHA